MTPSAFLDGLRVGDAHEGGIRLMRLWRIEEGFVRHLGDEVIRLAAEEPFSRADDARHVTHWTQPRGVVRQFSLLNGTGRFDDFSSDHDLSCFGKRFWHAERYPALSALIAAFPSAVNFRINGLGPGARLSAHEEQLLFRARAGGVGARLRRHLPIVTSPEAELVLDGDVHHLETGVVHLVNQGCVHTARNAGATERLHLVWDALLTRADFDLMFGPAPLPFPAVRVEAEERIPAPSRTERMGAWVALPRTMSAQDARSLDWCEPQ